MPRHALPKILSILCLLVFCAGSALADEPDSQGKLTITASGDEYLAGTFSVEEVGVDFEITTSRESLQIVLSTMGGERVLMRSELDLREGSERTFLGQRQMQSPVEALGWLRSAEARVFASVWRSMQLSHSDLLQTPAGRTLSSFSVHIEEAVGALGSKTDAELIAELAVEGSANFSRQERVEGGTGFLAGPEVLECGYGNECTGCCGFGCSCNFGCSNYCYRHDLCCDIFGWGYCFSSCYGAAAVITGGPYPSG